MILSLLLLLLLSMFHHLDLFPRTQLVRIIQSITLSNELLQSFNICCWHIHLNVIMPRATCPKGYGLTLVGQCLKQRLAVIEWNNGIFTSMNYIDGTSGFETVSRS